MSTCTIKIEVNVEFLSFLFKSIFSENTCACTHISVQGMNYWIGVRLSGTKGILLNKLFDKLPVRTKQGN